MADLSLFKIDRLTYAEIWSEADKFRASYAPGGPPIKVEEIIEFDLNFEIRGIRGLYIHNGINAFYPNAGKIIFVDEDDYFGGRKVPLMRYTLAHEIGHIVLHDKYLPHLKAKSIKEWKEIKMTLPPEQYGRLEFQAFEFAGRLLVEPGLLRSELAKQVNYITGIKNDFPEYPLSELQEIVARNVCNVFDVSEMVIVKRIDREKIDIFRP